MLIEESGVIFHGERSSQTAFEPGVKLNEVRISIIEQGLSGHEAKRDSKSTAKRLDEAAVGERFPERTQMRNEPTFAPSPF